MERQYYLLYREAARRAIVERAEHFSVIMDIKINRIAIRNQRRRWGSCSSKGNLNFNYKLLFVEPRLLDYVVVHELCHLQHFNHGAAFWATVGVILPDYETSIKSLRAIEQSTRLCPVALQQQATHLPPEYIVRPLKLATSNRIARRRPLTFKRQLMTLLKSL